MKQKTVKLTIVGLLILITASANANAGFKDQKAEEILNKYVTAAGGRDAIEKVQNLVSTSELLFQETGISINRKIIETRSQEYYIKVTSSRLGEITRGYDGSNYWEKRQDKIRLIDEAEKKSILNSTAFLRYAEWKKNLVSCTYEGIVNKGETELHKVAVVTIYGAKETWYFYKTNNLLAQIEESLELPGEISSVVTSFEDYREVNGVFFSFTQTIHMPGQTRRITFSEILPNQEINQSMFRMPGTE